jgi:hypothetical protein
VGGLSLCADYTVTAAISCLDAFRYLGVHGEVGGVRIELICMLSAIGIIGAINWFGPRGMGRIALVVAVATVALTAVVAICALPSLSHTRLELPVRDRSLGAWADAWVGFTEIVLALSGIEAIANMTGIMVSPVRVTSRRSIVPVLVEVVVLNLILGAAMNALPDARLIDPQGHPLGTDDMMNVRGSPCSCRRGSACRGFSTATSSAAWRSNCPSPGSWSSGRDGPPSLGRRDLSWLAGRAVWLRARLQHEQPFEDAHGGRVIVDRVDQHLPNLAICQFKAGVPADGEGQHVLLTAGGVSEQPRLDGRHRIQLRNPFVGIGEHQHRRVLLGIGRITKICERIATHKRLKVAWLIMRRP